jgi:Holliday junction DNA helicase RuvA
MIGRITGTLLEKNPPQVLIDAHGIAYEVAVPMSTFYNLPATGERVMLHTHLVVREDAHLLYGFGTPAERGAFRQLLKISGVGPKVALAVLSGLSVGDLARAVAAQESARLTKIPGVGKKTAERLLLELRDKLRGDAGAETAGGAMSAQDGIASDIVNALIALGYNEREALAAYRALPNDVSVADGIRLALKALAKP